jgi:hypothetical protein
MVGVIPMIGGTAVVAPSMNEAVENGSMTRGILAPHDGGPAGAGAGISPAEHAEMPIPKSL